jgi:hypothetical protein
VAGLATVWRAISPERVGWGIRGSAKTERSTAVYSCEVFGFGRCNLFDRRGIGG